MTEKKNYYSILGISKTDDLSEIRKNYKQQALRWHPDKNPNNIKEAEEKIKDINEAYEILSDKTKRENYDKGENVSLENYGYDYGEEIEKEGTAVGKYLNHKDELNKAWGQLFDFAINNNEWREKNMLSDYHLIRAVNLVKILEAYYKPKYIAPENRMKRWELMKEFGFQWWTVAGQDSSEQDWEGKVGLIKRNINFVRGYLGLPKLTDKDFQFQPIKGNNQGPKIPGNGPDKINENQEPPKIKDGIADIEEYNKLYYQGKHETIDKYWKLRDAIYNTLEACEKYKAVNSALLNQIDSKSTEAEKQNFREIRAKDNETKIREIKEFNEAKLEIAKEAIKLMEKIIEEGKNYKSNNLTATNTQSTESKKRKSEFEAREENYKKNKTIGDELSSLIKEAQAQTTYEELEAKIEEIDKYQGEMSYDERKEEIKQLKNKLGDLDKDKYREKIVEKIKSELEESGIKESDLDEESKEELSKLRNGEINDIGKINELENKINTKTGEKKAENNLSSLLEQAKKLVEGVTRGTADFLQKELQKIKKDLYSFSFSNNVYWNSAYQNKENDVKQMLTKLENYSVQNNATQQPKSSFFRKEIIIPFSLLAIILTGAVIVIRRRRQLKKAK